MHYNVMNYNEILFLIIMGVVMQRNCLGCYCLRWQLAFSGGVHYPGAIFRVAIIWGTYQ